MALLPGPLTVYSVSYMVQLLHRKVKELSKTTVSSATSDYDYRTHGSRLGYKALANNVKVGFHSVSL